ncbi:MAG TPA: hypothetical protein VHY32_07600 [Caulobacteraceae bacterium]|jgi:hypothetical protein|nr:hypothetical protein [Caulobacteraceae bacterium]
MKQAAKIAAGVVVLLALSACVAGSGESAHAASGGFVAQFLLGLWHGVIGPFTLIVEIVNRFAPHALPWKAHLYEAKAEGVAYDIGFYLGLAGSPVVIASRR